MQTTLIRGVIVYIIIVSAIRLMGKRQIGDLQPSDLVITILISEIATEPIVDSEASLIECMLTVMLLAAIEIAVSVVCMKSGRIRKLIDGNEIMLIKGGRIETGELKKLRFTVDDLLSALRQKDVFDISDVDYAYVETNGALSVMLKSDKQPVTAGQLSVEEDSGAIPLLIISDGKVITENFSQCGVTHKRLTATLRAEKLKPKDVLIMTAKPNGSCVIADKSGTVTQKTIQQEAK